MRHLFIFVLVSAVIADNNACQVSSEEKQALFDIVSEYWNSVQANEDMNDSLAFTNWFLQYASEDIYYRIVSPSGEHIYHSRSAALDKETGILRTFDSIRNQDSIILTMGSNLEYSCQEEEDGTRVISVVTSVHMAIHFDEGQVVKEILREFQFIYDSTWICVKIEYLALMPEIMELTGGVSMIERKAILNQIIAYLDALETASNSRNPNILNDWILGNTVEEFEIIGPSEFLSWNSREEALNEETGMYASLLDSFYQQPSSRVLISMGANVRYSCDMRDGIKVVSAKSPVHYVYDNDKGIGQFDELVVYEFVQVAGIWRMKKRGELAHILRVKEGSVPQELVQQRAPY